MPASKNPIKDDNNAHKLKYQIVKGLCHFDSRSCPILGYEILKNFHTLFLS